MKNRRTFIVGCIGLFPVSALAEKFVRQVTPSEIEGPFYPIFPQKDQDFDLTQIAGHTEQALGAQIYIKGSVRDADGEPLENATVDIWQANAAGRYRHPHDSNPAPIDPNFQGWAIVQSGTHGHFSFKTVMPGAYPASNRWTRPPHIHFKVSKIGYVGLTTQMYFPDHPLNQKDRLLQHKNEAERKLMIAQKIEDEQNSYSYTIYLKKL